MAAERGRPTEALRDALARQVGDIPIVQDAARELGSVVGHGLDRTLGGVIGKVERVIDDVQAGMGEAIDVLDELDARVAQYAGQARRPVSVLEDSGLIGKIVPVDRANVVLDVAACASLCPTSPPCSPAREGNGKGSSGPRPHSAGRW